MVEIHYEEERAVQYPDGAEGIEIVHWRILVDDTDAAIEQVAQDLADGRNPLQVVRADSDTKPKWDYRKDYDPSEWSVLAKGADLRRRAKAISPAFGD